MNKTTIILLLSIAFSSALGQTTSKFPFLEWSTNKGVQQMFQTASTVIDNQYNSITLGSSLNDEGNYDIMLTKHDKFGIVQWSYVYDSNNNGDDIGIALILDSSGNSYLTGTIETGTNAYDIIVQKVSSSGMNIFTYTYSNLSVGYEGGTCIDLTSSGDVIVGGVAASSNLSIDQFYCKLNSSGLEQWVVTWDNNDGYDGVVRIEEVNGTIYSAGVTAVQTNAWRYVTQKMSSFDGSISNTTISSGGAETIDIVSDFVVDAQDNLYVLGSVEISPDIHDGKIVKLDDNLNVLWEYQFDGLDGLDDQFRALTLDQNDNPVVAGHTTQNGNKDIQIIKFTSSGSISWSNSYNSQYGLDDMANDIVLNTSNEFIVGGTQETEFVDLQQKTGQKVKLHF